MIDIGDWEVGPTSWLYKTGTNEFGEDVIEESIGLAIINARGDRWKSRRSFDTFEAANAFIPVVEAALAAGAHPARSAKWYLSDPVYGSAAYTEIEPELVARERADEEAGLA